MIDLLPWIPLANLLVVALVAWRGRARQLVPVRSRSAHPYADRYRSR